MILCSCLVLSDTDPNVMKATTVSQGFGQKPPCKACIPTMVKYIKQKKQKEDCKCQCSKKCR